MAVLLTWSIALSDSFIRVPFEGWWMVQRS
jgi:hypothetical protein